MLNSDIGYRPSQKLRVIDAILFMAGAISILALAIHSLIINQVPDDLQVYKGAVDAWIAGDGLFSFARPNGDHFTYPPASAMVLYWVHWLDGGILAAAWVVLTGCAMAASALALSRAVGAPPGLSFLLLLVSAAGRSNLHFGQFSIFIFTLVLVDCCLVPRRYRGLLTGFAAAMKLTPLLFLAYFAARRQWGFLARGIAGAAVLTFAGAIALPAPTLEYLQSGVWGVSTVSHWDSPGNQSLRAVLGRLGLDHGPVAAILSLIVITIFLTWMARRKGQDELAEWTLVGLLTIIVSPISWTHHRFWLTVPLVMPLWTIRWPRLGRGLAMLATLFVAVAVPAWWLWPLQNLAFITCVALIAILVRHIASSKSVDHSGAMDSSGSGTLSQRPINPHRSASPADLDAPTP